MEQLTNELGDFVLPSKLVLNNREFQSGTKIVRKQGCGSIIGTLSEPHRKVLFYLYQNKGQVVSKQILKSVGWAGKAVTSASVLVAIYEIRRILDCRCIQTLSNEGYVMEQRNNPLLISC
ncbi:transcriptional regulator [Vibrio cyclitrophicus]|uniref:winged helix-turn-helix domain-containing protein n=1 Tax=Vibrio cyclitrophicus TaxID=47951 RepID=UPI0035A6BEA5